MAAFCHLSSVRPSTWPLYCEIVMKRLLSKWPLKARISDSTTIAGGHFSYGLEHDLVLQKKLVGLAFFLCLVARGLPAVCWWK